MSKHIMNKATAFTRFEDVQNSK